MDQREKEQGNLFLQSLNIEMVRVSGKRPFLKRVLTEEEAEEQEVILAYNDITRYVKRHYRKGIVDVRHFVSKEGRAYFELRQGDKKAYIQSPLYVEILSAAWSSFVWLRSLCAQKIHTREMMALAGMLDRHVNIRLDTSRMNVLYWPFISAQPHPFAEAELMCGHRKEAEETVNVALKGLLDDLKEERYFKMTDGSIPPDLSLYQLRDMYMNIFSWVQPSDFVPGKPWNTLYNQDAGKDFLNE